MASGWPSTRQDFVWDLELGMLGEEPSPPSPTLAKASAEVRVRFVGKVLAVLAVHCGLIAALGATSLLLDGLMWGSDKAVFVSAAVCCFCIVTIRRHQDVAKMAPMSCTLLVALSIAVAVLLGTLESKSCILLALVVVASLAAIFLGMALLVMTGNSTMLGSSVHAQGGMMASICLVSLTALVGIVSLVDETPDWTSISEAFCVMLFLSFNIIHESNSVLNGTSKIADLDPKDYVFAAIFLYMDLGNFMRSLPDLLGGRPIASSPP